MEVISVRPDLNQSSILTEQNFALTLYIYIYEVFDEPPNIPGPSIQAYRHFEHRAAL